MSHGLEILNITFKYLLEIKAAVYPQQLGDVQLGHLPSPVNKYHVRIQHGKQWPSSEPSTLWGEYSVNTKSLWDDAMTNWLVVSNVKFIFYHIWDIPSHWHIFFKMVKSTNLINGSVMVY